MKRLSLLVSILGITLSAGAFAENTMQQNNCDAQRSYGSAATESTVRSGGSTVASPESEFRFPNQRLYHGR